jgi:cysteine desulfurase
MERKRVYLDYAATTPVEKRAIEAMLPYMTELFGNPSSKHCFGKEAKKAVGKSRDLIVDGLGIKGSSKMIFTSGATESNNLAIFGVARAMQAKGRHIITCATEHKAVLKPCTRLERDGFEVSTIGVDADGIIDLQQFSDSLRDDTVMVSVLHTHNEIGIIQPVQEIGRICRERNIVLHCDATQSIGKTHFSMYDLQIDLLSLSAHKFYGPRGVGALVIRESAKDFDIEAQIYGGGQQMRLRSGTVNVAGIVGMAEAFKVAEGEWQQDYLRYFKYRDFIKNTLQKQLDGIYFNGSQTQCCPSILNVGFRGLEIDDLLSEISEIAVSSASACGSENPRPSYVLKAMGQTESESRNALRISFGRFTTQDDLSYAVERIIEAVKKLRVRDSFSKVVS